jgi:hypothetical protein
MHTVAALDSHIKRVEQELDVTQSLLSVVLQQLQRSIGDKALSPSLHAVFAADEPTRIRKLVDEIDENLVHGHEPLAARLLHERTGIIWDDAHEMLGQWPALNDERKVRWLRGMLLIQAARNAGDS